MDDTPLISIIIPTYNRGPIIKDSIVSVLKQTYENFELIIVDDGSTDNTKDVITALNDERVRYIYQDNAGACRARNNGIAHAKGDYIAFHDSDDIWHPDKLEKQMAAIAEFDADVVVSKLVLYENGEKKYLLPKRVKEGFVKIKHDIFGIGTQTILAKRRVFEKEKFDNELPRLQELEWLIRILSQQDLYKVYCLGEGLVDYTINPDSITENPEKLYMALRIILDKHPYIKKKSPLICAHAFKDLLKNKSAIRQYSVSRRDYRQLMKDWFPLTRIDINNKMEVES